MNHPSEAEIVQRFFDGIERYNARPHFLATAADSTCRCLHYRALRHGIQAPRYWEHGDNDRDFKWNNYLSRFHWRHVDLMDVLANFNPRANAELDEIASMLGFPGQTWVWTAAWSGRPILDGGIRQIRDYCETDVINTWLVYLRFEFMRGNFDD